MRRKEIKQIVHELKELGAIEGEKFVVSRMEAFQLLSQKRDLDWFSFKRAWGLIVTEQLG